MSRQPLRPLTRQAVELLNYVAECWEAYNRGPQYADLMRDFRRAAGTLAERIWRLRKRGLLTADFSTTLDGGERQIPGTLRLTPAGRAALQAAAQPADTAATADDGPAMEDGMG